MKHRIPSRQRPIGRRVLTGATATVAAVTRFAPAAMAASGGYDLHVLVANDASYNPEVMVDPDLANPWGLSLRPPGAGGHFWTSNFATGTTTTYVGDVHGPGGTFTPLYQDSLKVVNIGAGAGADEFGNPRAPTPMPTGQVYNYSATDFVVSGEGITGASKFLFVTAEGTISGWTEVPDPANPGRKLRQTASVVTVDHSQQYVDDRLRYVGAAVTDFAADNKLYVANYIDSNVEVFDKNFAPVAIANPGAFRYPGQREDYHPWNVQYLRTGPDHEGRLWVAYAQGDDPWEQQTTSGMVAEFDLDGNFLRRLRIALDSDPAADSELRAPWGLAVAPANFGTYGNDLLVANFGDGSIAAYDPATAEFIDFLRDAGGNVISIDGLWGLAFGNGVSLGDADALYFTAGPNAEQDGMFGSIRFEGSVYAVPEPGFGIAAVVVAPLLFRRRVATTSA